MPNTQFCVRFTRARMQNDESRPINTLGSHVSPQICLAYPRARDILSSRTWCCEVNDAYVKLKTSSKVVSGDGLLWSK